LSCPSPPEKVVHGPLGPNVKGNQLLVSGHPTTLEIISCGESKSIILLIIMYSVYNGMHTIGRFGLNRSFIVHSSTAYRIIIIQ
jgi:hypothetical protein